MAVAGGGLQAPDKANELIKEIKESEVVSIDDSGRLAIQFRMEGVDLYRGKNLQSDKHLDKTIGDGYSGDLTIEQMRLIMFDTYDKYGNRANFIVRCGKGNRWYIKYVGNDFTKIMNKVKNWRETTNYKPSYEAYYYQY